MATIQSPYKNETVATSFGPVAFDKDGYAEVSDEAAAALTALPGYEAVEGGKPKAAPKSKEVIQSTPETDTEAGADGASAGDSSGEADGSDAEDQADQDQDETPQPAKGKGGKRK